MTVAGGLSRAPVNPILPDDYYVNRAVNQFFVFVGDVVDDELDKFRGELFVVGKGLSEAVGLEFPVRLDCPRSLGRYELVEQFLAANSELPNITL